MNLSLTPDMIAAAYELLRTTPPFRRWKLPPAEEVEFRVGAYETHFADHCVKKHQHIITVSYKTCKQLATLLPAIAHEMIHVRQAEIGTHFGTQHGYHFQRMADSVCRHHGFDRGAF